MEMICYLPPSPYCTQILGQLGVAHPGTAMEVFESLAPFLKRLLRPSRAETCLLIVPVDHTDINTLLANIDLLRDIPLVLVTPDALSHTLAKSHRLRPRFLTDRDTDPREVVEVIARILARFQEPQTGDGGGQSYGGGNSAQTLGGSGPGGMGLRLI